MRTWNTTWYVDNQNSAEIKPAKAKQRRYLFIQNVSAFDIYYNEETRASVDFGTVIGPGLFLELDKGVPEATLYISGSQLGVRQQVNVKEGY